MIAAKNTTTLKHDELEKSMLDIDIYLRSSGYLTEEEIQVLSQMMTIKTVKKNSFLLKEGQIASSTFYILKGCLRQYYLKDGEEKTISFFTEGDTISINSSYVLRMPSKYYLECIEDTTVTVISYENDKKMKTLFPRLASCCSEKTEEELGIYQDSAADYIVSTPEERYLKLVETRADLLDRVPQYHLASYLGVKPESLSRIRKRIKTGKFTS